MAGLDQGLRSDGTPPSRRRRRQDAELHRCSSRVACQDDLNVFDLAAATYSPRPPVRTLLETLTVANQAPDQLCRINIRVSRPARHVGRLPSAQELSAALASLGYHKIVHYVIQGRSVIDLHLIPAADTGGRDDDLAALTSAAGGDELVVFDTERDRVGGLRVPGPTSIDNPSSPAGRLLAASKAGGSIAKMAHLPEPLSLLGGHIQPIVSLIRKARGHESDRYLRQARFRIELMAGGVVAIVAPRADRPLIPDWRVESASPNEARRILAANVRQLVNDVLDEINATLGGTTTVSGAVVAAAVAKAGDAAVQFFRVGKKVPIEIRQLRFIPGPAQFVRRVSLGESP